MLLPCALLHPLLLIRTLWLLPGSGLLLVALVLLLSLLGLPLVALVLLLLSLLILLLVTLALWLLSVLRPASFVPALLLTMRIKSTTPRPLSSDGMSKLT
jgi:hypothetical protein